jgi:hypothetical protein
MIWMVEKLKTRLCLKETQYNFDVPIQIEIEYQLEGDKIFSPSLSREIHYNRPLLVKEAISRSVAELDHLVNQEVQRAMEGHFSSRGYVFERKDLE